MESNANIAVYVGIAIVIYMLCHVYSVRLASDWIVVCGASVGALIACSVGLFILPSESTGDGFSLTTIPVMVALLGMGGVWGYRLMILTTEAGK